MTTTVVPEQMDENLRALRAEIERKTGKTAEHLYDEREKRLREAIEVKQPDRVPIFMQLPSHRFGPPPKEATRKAALFFEPDMCQGMGFMNARPLWEALDIKNTVWPGHGLPADATGHQAIEGEYMKADEYDLFFKDPADFSIRKFLPRVYGALQPLAKLPDLSTLFMGGIEGIAALAATPDFEQMAEALAKAGNEMKKARAAMAAADDLALLGFPAFSHPGSNLRGAPFDEVSAHLRGMTGSMVDMFQRPEKLLKACDMIADMQIARATPADPAKRGNPKRNAMPLWRGDKFFMSQKQFEKFYWPGLKKIMQASIDMGYIPMPFFEAEFGKRLECLLDLPKGKVIASIQHMDIALAKDILKDHTCIMGQAPFSLRYSSLNEAGAYFQNMVRTGGKGGGFILWMALPTKGSLEDLKAMVDSVKEAGRF